MAEEEEKKEKEQEFLALRGRPKRRSAQFSMLSSMGKHVCEDGEILMADDEPLSLMIFQHIVHEQGFSFDSASTGSDAVTKVAKRAKKKVQFG